MGDRSVRLGERRSEKKIYHLPFTISHLLFVIVLGQRPGSVRRYLTEGRNEMTNEKW